MHLLLKINRIRKHLQLSRTLPPALSHLPCHKCMVPYETLTEIAALNILQH